jgi:hypothetical protein
MVISHLILTYKLYRQNEPYQTMHFRFFKQKQSSPQAEDKIRAVCFEMCYRTPLYVATLLPKAHKYFLKDV